jgi:hypothetical protein
MPTTILQPDGTTGLDTYIYQLNPTFNHGTSFSLVAGRGGASNAVTRSLIQFDLSVIPSGAIVDSAVLTLWCHLEDSTTNRNVWVHRSLVEWFEGSQGGAAPSGGQDGSTWNLQNANGADAWPSGAGAGIGTPGVGNGVERAVTPSDFQTITAPNAFYNWTVTADVQGFINGSFTNYGWWLDGVYNTNSSNKYFRSSDVTTAAQRPQLTVTYHFQSGSAAATSTASGLLIARAVAAGSSDGTSTVTGEMVSDLFMRGDSAGTSTVSGALTADALLTGLSEGSFSGTGTMVSSMGTSGVSEASSFMTATMETFGAIAGTSDGVGAASATLISIGLMIGSSSGAATSTGTLAATGNSTGGLATGVATVSGRMYSRWEIFGTATGVAVATASITLVGFLRGESIGAADVTGRAWGRRSNVVFAEVCNIDPLLFITDGSQRETGQENRIDLLSRGGGFLLSDWRPNIAQYKGGGYYSNSALGQGRRLSRRVFDNAIEIMVLKAKAAHQNQLIAYVRELFHWQEAAADYWTSDWATRPVYIGARAARETYTRYALIHTISIPELENPYGQPFFTNQKPALEELTLRIERDPWTSTIPGAYDPVFISNTRSWTVSGWQVGS